LLNWFGFMVLNQIVTNFSLKQTEPLKKTEPNQIDILKRIVSIFGSVYFCSVQFSSADQFIFWFFAHPYRYGSWLFMTPKIILSKYFESVKIILRLMRCWAYFMLRVLLIISTLIGLLFKWFLHLLYVDVVLFLMTNRYI
jgi:hypothetical protein